MEELKNWGFLLLFISAGSLIYCFLLPSGGVSKTAKSVISVAVIISLSLPLFNVFGNFSAESFIFEEAPEIENYDEHIIEAARNAVENTVHETVIKYTTVPYETEIFIDNNKENGINIEYVGIVFSAEPQREKELREALFDALGIMADIRVEYISE